MISTRRFNPLSFNFWFKAVSPSLVEFALAALILFFPFSHFAQRLPFYIDETLSIDTSRSVDVLLHADFNNPIWDMGYATVTAPPMTRYLAGLSCLVTTPDAGMQDLISRRGLVGAAKTDAGRGFLYLCRRPFVWSAVLAGLVGFMFVSLITGRAAGWLWVFLFAGNRFCLKNLPMVMNEAPLLMFTGAAALACLMTVETHQFAVIGRKMYRWAALCGVLIGLAASCKINGALACGAGAICLIVAGAARIVRGKNVGTLPIVVCIALIFGIAGLTFIGLNPFLYPDPIGRMHAMVDHRLGRLDAQSRIFSALRVEDGGDHIYYLAKMYGPLWASFRFMGSDFVNFALSVTGIARLFVLGVRWVRGNSENPAAAVAVIWGAVLSAPILKTHIAWTRYFLFPVAVTQASIAIGFAFLLSLVVGRLTLPLPGSLPNTETR